MNTFKYYVLIILPLCIVFLCGKFLGKEFLIIGLILYFLYRPLIDIQRLREKNIKIDLKNLYSTIFYYQVLYFKKLYL
ncbi:MAG: hypothetical protein JWQ25_1463 [Daejeonella sp.]|nr:hypothetical protein [Daejeonella sp.]